MPRRIQGPVAWLLGVGAGTSIGLIGGVAALLGARVGNALAAAACGLLAAQTAHWLLAKGAHATDCLISFLDRFEQETGVSLGASVLTASDAPSRLKRQIGQSIASAAILLAAGAYLAAPESFRRQAWSFVSELVDDAITNRYNGAANRLRQAAQALATWAFVRLKELDIAYIIYHVAYLPRVAIQDRSMFTCVTVPVLATVAQFYADGGFSAVVSGIPMLCAVATIGQWVRSTYRRWRRVRR